MPPRRNDPKVKPVEEWGKAEWETAYNIQATKFEALKKELKGILRYLHHAMGKIQEIVN